MRNSHHVPVVDVEQEGEIVDNERHMRCCRSRYMCMCQIEF
jgi:hypothetical protein